MLVFFLQCSPSFLFLQEIKELEEFRAKNQRLQKVKTNADI